MYPRGSSSAHGGGGSSATSSGFADQQAGEHQQQQPSPLQFGDISQLADPQSSGAVFSNTIDGPESTTTTARRRRVLAAADDDEQRALIQQRQRESLLGRNKRHEESVSNYLHLNRNNQRPQQQQQRPQRQATRSATPITRFRPVASSSSTSLPIDYSVQLRANEQDAEDSLASSADEKQPEGRNRRAPRFASPIKFDEQERDSIEPQRADEGEEEAEEEAASSLASQKTEEPQEHDTGPNSRARTLRATPRSQEERSETLNQASGALRVPVEQKAIQAHDKPRNWISSLRLIGLGRNRSKSSVGSPTDETARKKKQKQLAIEQQSWQFAAEQSASSDESPTRAESHDTDDEIDRLNERTFLSPPANAAASEVEYLKRRDSVGDLETTPSEQQPQKLWSRRTPISAPSSRSSNLFLCQTDENREHHDDEADSLSDTAASPQSPDQPQRQQQQQHLQQRARRRGARRRRQQQLEQQPPRGAQSAWSLVDQQQSAEREQEQQEAANWRWLFNYNDQKWHKNFGSAASLFQPSRKRQFRSIFSSSSSIFALYAHRYAFDKFQLALRAFKEWYHENLTYHHIRNRMEFNKQQFERWFNKRGRPLNLRALDHYDQVVIWIADERDSIQKRTFTKWINKYLLRRGKQMQDLFQDLRDGQNLITLLEMLSGQTLPRERGRMRVHQLQNIQIALNYIKFRKVKLVNIRPEDIADGNQKLTLGLIWTIILHFQLEDDSKFREVLLRWAQRTTDGYPGCRVTDLTTSWRDGLAYNAIIHRNRPDLLDYLGCRKKTSRENLDQAFTVADRDLGVARLLEPEDVDVPCPDEKSMITYLAQLYELFPDPPERNPLLDAEKIRRIDEYKEIASRLLKWIKDSTVRLDDRRFPKAIAELKKLKDETERFRTEEVPPKQHDKQRLASHSREIYDAARELNIRIPDELMMDNIDFHWDRMMNAIKARNKALDDEMAKAERLRAMLEKLLADIKKTNDRLDGIERQMNDEEQRVSRMETLKDAESFSPAVLQKISEDLADCGIKIDSIKRLAEDFIQENGRTAPDSIMIREKVAELEGRYKKLLAKRNRLHDEYDRTMKRLREMEDAMRRAQAQKEAEAKLRLKLDAMKRQLDELERRIDNMGPVARDLPTLQRQLAELNEFDKDLNKARHNLNDLIKLAEGMIADDLIADPIRLRSELQSLKDQLARIEDKAARRLREFEAALKKAEDQKAAEAELNMKLDGLKKELDELERRIDNMAPIGKDLATLQRQLTELRDFEQDVGRVRSKLNDTVQLADSLIRQDLISDPTSLRSTINLLKDQLARIDEKVARRLRALQDALKRAEAQREAEQKFNLRLDGMKRELDELERRLDNMAPVAKDLGQLQQQLEEMQDFNERLNKTRNNLNELIKAGEELIREDLIADPAALRQNMKALKDQLARIEEKAAKRLRDIQDAMGRVAASGAIQDVAKWLERAKKVLVSEENVHGDLDTVNALIEQHKSFQDELQAKQPAIAEVRRMEKELSNASPQTGALVRDELQSLSNQWRDVEKLTREKSVKLEEALRAAEQMHQSVHGLLEWAADAESKLRFAGAMPDDEPATKLELANHEKFMRKLASQGQVKDQTLKLAQEILSKCHPDAEPVIKHWINIIQSRWEEIDAWAKQRGSKLQDYLRSLMELLELVEELIGWLSRHESRLNAEETEQLPTNANQLESMIDAHSTFMEELRKREPDVDRVVKIFASKASNATSKMIVTTTTTKPRAQQSSTSDLSSRSGRLSGGARSATPTRTSYATYRDEYPEVRQARARVMLEKWRSVWQLSLDKMQRLKDRVEHLHEVERLENFDFDQWRRRFITWINANKGRVMDFFRSIDDDNDGRIPIESFVSGVLRSKFETSRLEMERVAEIFDKNNDGTVDNKEYLDTLRPDKPITDDELIQDEVQRQVSKCTCAQRYRVYHVGEGRYRFGESQKLRLVRILRSTVMVRVGGGWEPLTTFLQKNDPCRAKGRTNVELREQFILPEGASQAMAAFRSKMSRDPGSMPVLGPITKIREKTDRSMPMSGQTSRFGSPSDYFSESESTSKTRSRIGRLTPSTSSRPPSRSASRPTSRNGSDLGYSRNPATSRSTDNLQR